MTSSSSDSDEFFSNRAKPSRRSTRETRVAAVNVLSSSSSDSDHRAPKRLKPQPRSAREPRVAAVNYRDSTSEESVGEEETLDWEDQAPETAAAEDEATSAVPTVERVLRHRHGDPDAVGTRTTIYNVRLNGDPNSNVDTISDLSRELQFLIKWSGRSHWHNTWESEESLKTLDCKGAKKVENYRKRMHQVDQWKRGADKDYVEVYDCEKEMNEELLEQYKEVERIIGHREVTNEDASPSQSASGDANAQSKPSTTTEYFTKWNCLPYADATWESEQLLRENYAFKIDEYKQRRAANTAPSQSQKYRRRPRFEKLEVMPAFLRQRQNPDMELRDYQLEGLNWLLHAWSKGNSVILADEMGLGKTIQSISFLSSLFHIYQIYGPFLVVVPLSTMPAWQREFEAWAPDMNLVVYMGDGSSREMIKEYELFKPSTKQLRVNVVLTTYEILLRDRAFLSEILWMVLMVDEAHRLKNDDSQLYRCLFEEFSTYHRVLITGTPLQNSLKELWALLHFIMPDSFDNWDQFERAHQDQNDHKGISALHRKLEPYLLRRVKKDVEKSLPAKVEQILRVDMTVQQKQYYKWILTRNYEELSKGAKGSISGFVNIIMTLKKCCNHSSLVRPYDDIKHESHTRLQQLLKSSGKLILLDKLLCRLKETGHRVLIFSQMVMMLDVLEEYLQLRRFNAQRLDGSMRADLRKQALDHFNAPGSTDFCFLLSTRAGGLGINLATADTVIIFDSDWNPQNDLQAMSRAHRIGQKKQVNIYRLVTRNSVEENIVERAKQKLVLDHLVIQRMDTTGRTVLAKSAANPKIPFDKNDLNAILKFGTEELFHEKDGEEQELEVDIDDILKGAETRECDNVETGSELLNSFKYTNFTLDEEKDLAALSAAAERSRLADTANDATLKSWDDIIPKERLDELKEEQRKKLAEELYLGPRQRVKANNAPEPLKTAIDPDDDRYVEKKKRTKRRKRKDDDEQHDADYGPAGSSKRKRARKHKSAETVETDGDDDDDEPSTAAARAKKARKSKSRPVDDTKSKSTPRSTPKGGRQRIADNTPGSAKEQRSPDKADNRVRVPVDRFRGVQNIKFNVDLYRDDAINVKSRYFSDVVQTFQPVKRYFMRLSRKDVSKDAADIAKPLRKVGNFIVDHVANMKEERRARWFNMMWIFVSNGFYPAKAPADIWSLYLNNLCSP